MEYYKEIFFADADKVSDDEFDSLIMCGTPNWDFYFSKPVKNYEERIKNVLLIEFEKEDEMFDFIDKNKFDIIDYSLEHEKPCVLLKK